jgi:hypothetical protein
MRKLSINDCVYIASINNGTCLSSAYKNNKSPVVWRCEFGHIWSSSLYSVRTNKMWCPYCAGNAKVTMDDCYNLAISMGGKCLSG